MVQIHLRHFGFGMKCRHKNKRTIRFISAEVKERQLQGTFGIQNGGTETL